MKGLVTMKVLLLKDIYNLGRAGEVKKVANGYGRNYLIPQGLAVLATPGTLKQAGTIKAKADVQRAVLNEEMSALAKQLVGVKLAYAAKAGETGKLYGSITSQTIAQSLSERLGTEIHRRQIDSQALRTLGVHRVAVHLTIDLAPEILVIIHREGESAEAVLVASERALKEEAVSVETVEDVPVAVDETDDEQDTAEAEAESPNEVEPEVV
jgi:large subunit ribosomal protein L9